MSETANPITKIESDIYHSSQVGNIKQAANYAEKILSQMRSAGIFLEYTEHDIQHSRRMLQICERLVPKKVQLNEIEKGLLVLAAYFHDIGMVVNKEIKEDILKNKSVENVDPYYLPTIQEFSLNYGERVTINDKLLEDYVRSYHHVLSARHVVSNWNEIGISENFRNILADICRSHGERKLNEEAKYNTQYQVTTPAGTVSVNIQYIAILLRLADILDSTCMRTPHILYKWILPIDAKAIEEWKRQMATVGVGPRIEKPKIIDISGDVSDPAIFEAVEEYSGHILNEIEYCRKIMSGYPLSLAERYALDVEDVSLDTFRTTGFEKKKLQFTADTEKVVKLFMGEQLYAIPQDEAIRELLLNAVDACRLRAEIDSTTGYWPVVKIVVNSADNALTIIDNGIGMNQYIVDNYLLKIGRSYYISPDFKKHQTKFKPSSRFGIGFLSSFLIAKSVEVTTRHLDGSGNIHLQIHDLNRHVILRIPQGDVAIGTTVKLLLKKPIDNVKDIVQRWFVHLDIPIEIDVNGNVTSIADQDYSVKPTFASILSGKVETISTEEVDIQVPGIIGKLGVAFSDSGQPLQMRFIAQDISRVASEFNYKMRVCCNGVQSAKSCPLPSHWNDAYFLYDLNVDTAAYALNPMLNRENLRNDESWATLCRDIENGCFDDLVSLLFKKNNTINNNIFKLITELFWFDAFSQAIPPSEKLVALLTKKLAWLSLRTESTAKAISIATALKRQYVILSPQINYKAYPGLISSKVYDKALEKRKRIVKKYGKGTIDVWQYEKAVKFLQHFITPESVQINSKGLSLLRCTKSAGGPGVSALWPSDGLHVPIYVDGKENRDIVCTVVATHRIYNSLHPLSSIIKKFDKCPTSKETKLLRIALRHIVDRSGFFLITRKSIKEMNDEMDKFCNAVQIKSIAINQRSFAGHDFVEFWQ